MDALTLLTFQATTADDLLAQVFAPVTAAQGAWHPDGSTANAITPTFLHVYISEDRLVSGATGRQLLWDGEGWGGRPGLDPANPWVAPPMNDLEPCRAYAGAVRAATKAFLTYPRCGCPGARDPNAARATALGGGARVRADPQ